MANSPVLSAESQVPLALISATLDLAVARSL
jgi:hypothetical protein